MKDPTSLAPAVARAFRILEILKGDGIEYTSTEIARALDLDKSTVYKLLAVLSHYGVVQRDEMTKRYSLGIALADYGRIALENLDIRHVAKPILRELMEFSGETAAIGVLQGTKVVMVDKKEPLVRLRVTPAIGWRFPATLSATGKVLLAWLPEDRIDEIIQKEGLPSTASKSVTDPIAYKADLAEIRKRGFAMQAEQFYDGVSAVAAPVFDPRGRAVAALSLSGPTYRMTEEKMLEFGSKCVALAGQLLRNSSQQRAGKSGVA